MDAAFAPYAYVQDGKTAGVYTELLKAAFSALPGYQVSLRPLPFSAGLQALQRGELLATGPLYINSARDYIDRYSEPIGVEELVVNPKQKCPLLSKAEMSP